MWKQRKECLHSEKKIHLQAKTESFVTIFDIIIFFNKRNPSMLDYTSVLLLKGASLLSALLIKKINK